MAYSGDCSAPLHTNWGKIKESDLDRVFLRLQMLDNIHVAQHWWVVGVEGEHKNS